MYGQLSPDEVKETRLNILTQRLHIQSKNSWSAHGKSEKFRSVMWLNVLKTYQKLISFMHRVLVGTLLGTRPPGGKGVDDAQDAEKWRSRANPVRTLGFHKMQGISCLADELHLRCVTVLSQIGTCRPVGFQPPPGSALELCVAPRTCQWHHMPDRATFPLTNRWTEAQRHTVYSLRISSTPTHTPVRPCSSTAADTWEGREILACFYIASNTDRVKKWLYVTPGKKLTQARYLCSHRTVVGYVEQN